MYLLADDKPVRFGDIFVSDWLSDAWLQEDAATLGPFTAKGGITAYSHETAGDDSDFLLAHGRQADAVLLLNDDCFVETVLVRHSRGRLQFAPIFALPAEPEARLAQLETRAYSRFPLPPAAEFAGGVADLRCSFGVNVNNKNACNRLTKLRRVRLNDYGRGLLEARWGAHAARRGPVVARTAAEKLVGLLPVAQRTDAKRAVERLLARTWSSEGGIADVIDTGVERGAAVETIIDDILQRADAIEQEAHESAALLRSVAAALV